MIHAPVLLVLLSTSPSHSLPLSLSFTLSTIVEVSRCQNVTPTHDLCFTAFRILFSPSLSFFSLSLSLSLFLSLFPHTLPFKRKRIICSSSPIDSFKDTYVPTIEDTYRQVICCNKNVCTLQITDTTGSHQFPAMQRLNISKGHAFMLVYR